MTHRHEFSRLIGALACCALIGGSAALGNSGTSGANAGSSGGDGGDSDAGGGVQLLSEAIGSLPGFWVEDSLASVSLPPGFDPTEQSDLHLEILVPDESLQFLFDDASGQGYALLSLPPEKSGWTRVRIFGQVDVGLNRAQVYATQATAELVYGVENLDGVASLAWNGMLVGQYALDGPVESLPVPLDSAAFVQSIASMPAVLAIGSPTAGVSTAALSTGEGAISFALN